MDTPKLLISEYSVTSVALTGYLVQDEASCRLIRHPYTLVPAVFQCYPISQRGRKAF
jgi:hypothetical protein